MKTPRTASERLVIPNSDGEALQIKVEDFRVYARLTRVDNTTLEDLLNTAVALIWEAVHVAKTPAPILKSAILQVATNLYQRRQSALEHGNLGDGPDTATPYHRPALDPLTPAWPLLRPYKKDVGLV